MLIALKDFDVRLFSEKVERLHSGIFHVIDQKQLHSFTGIYKSIPN